MLCLVFCLLGKKGKKGKTPLFWRKYVFNLWITGPRESLCFTQLKAQLSCSESRGITVVWKVLMGQFSLSPKWRQQRGKRELSSLGTMLVVQQFWEISDTREDGWEEGQGVLGTALEELKVGRELRLQRGWLLWNWAWESSSMEGEGGWFGLVWFDRCGPCLLLACTAVAMCPLERAWRTLVLVALSTFSFAQCL